MFFSVPLCVLLPLASYRLSRLLVWVCTGKQPTVTVDLVYDIVNLDYDIVNLVFDIVNLVYDIVNLVYDIVNLVWSNVNTVCDIVNFEIVIT